MLMAFGGDEVVALLLLSYLLVREVCKMSNWYFEVIYLANFVEISVRVFKILGILETDFAI